MQLSCSKQNIKIRNSIYIIDVLKFINVELKIEWNYVLD